MFTGSPYLKKKPQINEMNDNTSLDKYLTDNHTCCPLCKVFIHVEDTRRYNIYAI